MTRSPDKMIVAIFGGSFARGIYDTQMDFIKEQLEANTGKTVSPVQFTYGGYKQPQQALDLTYLLTLGAEFDVILNVVGFNDIVLGPIENLPKNVYPMYPRQWYFLAQTTDNPEIQTKLARLEVLGGQKQAWAGYFNRTPLKVSNLGLIVWRFRDWGIDRERHDLLLAIQAAQAERTAGFEVTGPLVPYSDEEKLYRDLADVWMRGSYEMFLASRSHGIDYYHFLQPNQYVEGSKPIGEEEAAVAYNPRHPYLRPVKLGYPLLVQKGMELQGQGVAFTDLTMIFADDETPRYRDDCCHLHAEGYRLVAEAILEAVLPEAGR